MPGAKELAPVFMVETECPLVAVVVEATLGGNADENEKDDERDDPTTEAVAYGWLIGSTGGAVDGPLPQP